MHMIMNHQLTTGRIVVWHTWGIRSASVPKPSLLLCVHGLRKDSSRKPHNYTWGILLSLPTPLCLYFHFVVSDNHALCKIAWIYQDGSPICSPLTFRLCQLNEYASFRRVRRSVQHCWTREVSVKYREIRRVPRPSTWQRVSLLASWRRHLLIRAYRRWSYISPCLLCLSLTICDTVQLYRIKQDRRALYSN